MGEADLFGLIASRHASTRSDRGRRATKRGAACTQYRLAGHADPRTTERYDRMRGRLDKSPVYALASALAE